MDEIIVLVMHGAPPSDFPREEMGEFFALGSRLRTASGPERAAMESRHAELEARMRAWPRTPQNDRFHAGSVDLAKHLEEVSGSKVVLGFGEFCAPTMGEALDQAAAFKPKRVTVVTPMMTRGGEHAESEIPAAVADARERHPAILFRYAWPFEVGSIAAFLAAQVAHFDAGGQGTGERG